MKHIQLFFIFSFALFACTQSEKQEEPDCEDLVEVEEEWSSLAHFDEKGIASDLLPEPQEVLLLEKMDSIPAGLEP